MTDYLALLGPVLVICVLLAITHCYLGIHVLMRGVIFVDLALAQIAALGATTAFLFGFDPHSEFGYVSSLGFTLLGAMIFALGRFKDQRVPQEAIIGIVYAVSSAVMMLILSQSAADAEEVKHMLTGQLLFVQWEEVWGTAVVYGAVLGVHALCFKPFLTISRATGAGQLPAAVRWWDFLFYATFGIVVTLSVKSAGVLPVFSFLIVPAACAAMFCGGVRNRLLLGWGLGLLGSFLGVAASFGFDLPTGESIVAAYGVVFGGCAVFYALRARTFARAAARAKARNVPGGAVPRATASPPASGTPGGH